MELLSYWTIPYVSINDSRLICLYNVAFLCVIGSLVGNIFWYMTYLQSDTLHGITQARLKTPSSWSDQESSVSEELCVNAQCVRWDAEEVGHSYTADSLFVATRIKDSIEKSVCEENNLKSEDEEIISCAKYKRQSKKYFYPINIESLSMILNADAEAFEFCNSEHYGVDEECPYEYSIRNLPGRLKSVNGSTIAKFSPDDVRGDAIKSMTVENYLQAAGVNSLDEDVLREKGGVFLINIKFHLDYSKIGWLTGLLSSPRTQKLPSKFTIHVNRLAQAGYKVKEVISHDGETRRIRTYYGLHFKIHVSGKAKQFSWTKLISEIVIKFGLLGVVSSVLDLLWQVVFPLIGFPDYNDLVFKSVNEASEENEMKADENKDKVD